MAKEGRWDAVHFLRDKIRTQELNPPHELRMVFPRQSVYSAAGFGRVAGLPVAGASPTYPSFHRARQRCDGRFDDDHHCVHVQRGDGPGRDHGFYLRREFQYLHHHRFVERGEYQDDLHAGCRVPARSTITSKKSTSKRSPAGYTKGTKTSCRCRRHSATCSLTSV